MPSDYDQRPGNRKKMMGMYAPPTDNMDGLRSPMLDTSLKERPGGDLQPFKQSAMDEGELGKGTRRRRTSAVG